MGLLILLKIEIGDVYGCGDLLRSGVYWRRLFGSTSIGVGNWLWDDPVAVIGRYRSDAENYSS